MFQIIQKIENCVGVIGERGREGEIVNERRRVVGSRGVVEKVWG